MFISVFIGIFFSSLFLILRDRVKYPRLTPKTLKRILKETSKKIALNKWEEAEKELKRLLERGEKEAILLYAQVLRGTNRFSEGLQLVQAAAREYPEELQFRYEEALFFLNLDQPKEALLCFRVCAPILRAESNFYEFATAHFQIGQIEQCWALIETWIPHTQHGKLLALGADCQFELKHYSEAIELYKKAMDCGVSNHQIMTKLAHTYRRQGNLKMAEDLFKNILNKDPADLAATLGLGTCLQERGWYQKALLFYQNGEAWKSRDPLLLKQAGLCALFTQKYSLAVSFFEEAIRFSDPSSNLLFYWAYSLERAQCWQEAEQAYLKLIKQFPSDGRGYRALAWLYGVGFSTTLSIEQGLHFAHLALKYLPDTISLEILSACEARRGHFQRAHQIQEYLLTSDSEKKSRLRRQRAMRILRKRVPLDDQLVSRTLVA